MMLVHIDQTDIAERVHNAWLRTLEDGVHTYDIYAEGVSKQKVGTKEFAEAVVARLGQEPQTLKPARYKSEVRKAEKAIAATIVETKAMVGADVFIDWTAGTAEEFGNCLKLTQGDDFVLSMIDNRGVKVWPGGFADTLTGDVWRCRFEGNSESKVVTHSQVTALLDRIAKAGYDFIKFESLCTFDGKPGYSLGQGQ